MVPSWLKEYLRDESLTKIEKIIEGVEEKTSAEVITMIVKKSTNSYQELSLLLISFFAMFFITQDPNLVFATAIGGALIYSVKKKVDKIESQNKAYTYFYEMIVGKTKNATGVLLFISIREKQVWIMGETNTKLSPESWQAVAQELTEGMKKQNLNVALENGLNLLGALLNKNCPPEKINLNEIPNQLIIREQ